MSFFQHFFSCLFIDVYISFQCTKSKPQFSDSWFILIPPNRKQFSHFMLWSTILNLWWNWLWRMLHVTHLSTQKQQTTKSLFPDYIINIIYVCFIIVFFWWLFHTLPFFRSIFLFSSFSTFLRFCSWRLSTPKRGNNTTSRSLFTCSALWRNDWQDSIADTRKKC